SEEVWARRQLRHLVVERLPFQARLSLGSRRPLARRRRLPWPERLRSGRNDPATANRLVDVHTGRARQLKIVEDVVERTGSEQPRDRARVKVAGPHHETQPPPLPIPPHARKPPPH